VTVGRLHDTTADPDVMLTFTLVGAPGTEIADPTFGVGRKDTGEVAAEVPPPVIATTETV
jgi:hypothetical protein